LSQLVRPETLAPGGYLTDERKLFRVIDRRAMLEETLIELEDCTTLDVWLVTPEEVAELRPVGALEADQPDAALAVGGRDRAR
jgi:hypothetical protein